MNVTLTRVADEHREFETKFGPMVSFQVWLDDGRMGEVTTKPEYLADRRTEFEAFVGTPTDLEVLDQGTFADGNPKPLKVKKPQMTSTVGGTVSPKAAKKDYVPRYTDTEAGWRESDERIDRRRSLELAVQLRAPEQADWMETANRMYKWLREPLEAVVDTHSRAPGISGSASLPPSRPEPATWGATAGTGMGEVPEPVVAPPLTASPSLPIAVPPEAKATTAQWAKLLSLVDGSTKEATSLINNANGTHYTYPSAKAGATWAELEKAMT